MSNTITNRKLVFTLKPCKHCGNPERYINSKKCPTCSIKKRKLRYDKNPEKEKAYGKQYRTDNPEVFHSSKLKTKFGISLVEYNKLLAEQNYCCAICEEPENEKHRSGTLKSLSVDHDHRCCPGNKSCGNCIRGLLCSRCNVGIGNLKDSPELLRKSAEYIEGRLK